MCQASLSFTISWSLLRLMSVESVMPSNHLILCYPLLILPSIFPTIRVFSNESALWVRWPKYWNFSFSISPSSEYSGLISLAHGKTKAQGGHEICLRFYSCLVEPPDSFLMFNDNNWNPWISVHFLWNHDFMFFLFFCFSKRQRKNGSSPLHAVNKEAEAQKLKDLPRSRRKAGVELVPEAKCPECHSGSAASICPLVLVTSASFRVGVKWRAWRGPFF